jgi:hypothetical protein
MAGATEKAVMLSNNNAVLFMVPLQLTEKIARKF